MSGALSIANFSPEFTPFGLSLQPDSSFSSEGKVVRNMLVEFVRRFELSQALFGKKLTAISQLLDLANECSEQDWDGYGARPVDIEAVAGAKRFVRALPPDATLPEFAPEPDGSISLDWARSRSCIFSISINSSDRLACAWIDGTDKGHAVMYFDGYTIPPRILEEIEAVTG